MAQIGRQPDHLARRVLAGAVPVEHRLHCEAVAKIVDARSSAMLAVCLMGPEPDLLARMREVVSGSTVGEACGLVGDEQRLGRMDDQPVAFGKIVDQLRDDARIERQQPLFAELALSDAQHAMLGVEVVTIEGQRLADPEPGDCDKPEQRRAGQPTQTVDGWQLLCRHDDRSDLSLAVDMRTRPLDGTRQQASRRHFMRRIEAAQPLREQAHDAEPRRSGRAAGLTQRGVPAKEQRRIDVGGAFTVGEPSEAAKDALTGAKVIAEVAPDAQIAVELGSEAHSAPPATGQGCAIDLSPSMSSRAYIIVDDLARCRNTSATSSREAPMFTSWVARL